MSGYGRAPILLVRPLVCRVSLVCPCLPVTGSWLVCRQIPKVKKRSGRNNAITFFNLKVPLDTRPRRERTAGDCNVLLLAKDLGRALGLQGELGENAVSTKRSLVRLLLVVVAIVVVVVTAVAVVDDAAAAAAVVVVTAVAVVVVVVVATASQRLDWAFPSCN
jgi:hypothetical protein